MSGRVLYLDGLRVFAIVAVIMVHVTCMFYTNSETSNWYAAYFYGSFVRWCVPVFCMISGALFLTKQELSVKDLYLRYIKRIVLAFLFWSTRISDLVFGVYLIHVVIFDKIMRIVSGIQFSARIEIPLIAMSVFLISLVIV